MQYLVIQEPKARYRASHVVALMVVEAASAAEAIRKANKGDPRVEQSNSWFQPHAEFKRPYAHPVVLDQLCTI